MPPEAVADVELVVTELVTNAVAVTPVPGSIGLSVGIVGSEVLIEVSDRAAEVPRYRCADQHDEDGRGLWLVEQLSRAWGWCHLPENKVVWAVVRPELPEQPDHREPALLLPDTPETTPMSHNTARRLPPLPDGHRILDFLGGEPVIVPETACRGCVMNDIEQQLPDLLTPVYDDGVITVRQDAEWAVPGFVVIGLRPHVGAVDQMDLELVQRLGLVTHFVRKAMRLELGLEAVQMYQEEKLDRPHFHIWMLPLWPEVMARHDINPRIYESNVAHYLTLFTLAEHQMELRSCLHRLRGYLDRVPELRRAQPLM